MSTSRINLSLKRPKRSHRDILWKKKFEKMLHNSFYHQTAAWYREFHYFYVRMSKERFDDLVCMIRTKITKKDTQMRDAITAEERLFITLRYLSTGLSQQDLCYNFRVGRTIVSNILMEVCSAMFEVLSPIYMKPPYSEDEWRHIADDRDL